MREFFIQKNEAGQRFDKYLKKLLCQASGSFIYKMLRKKNIVLNDKKADGSEKLQLNDHVKLYLSDETFQKFSEEGKCHSREENLPPIDLKHLPFQILYENEEILMINKPVGMLSQKSNPEDISANEYIIAYLLATNAIAKEELNTFRPSVCNRLDRNTSGILIAGKTLKGLQEMSQKLKKRTIQKYYRCIVEGEVHSPEHIEGYLQKEKAHNKVTITKYPQSENDKKIKTEYTPIQHLRQATVLEVYLITGRTHQIRAHLASIGHPIIGDIKYGAKKRNDIHAQLLHAHRLVLDNGEEIVAPLPKEFQKIQKELEKKE